jgi:hypothetical protein
MKNIIIPKMLKNQKAGYMVFLILMVLLGQTKFFYFFMYTTLGRLLLVLSLVYLSYIHKFLGLGFVLIVAVLLNVSGFAITEGFSRRPTKQEEKRQDKRLLKSRIEELEDKIKNVKKNLTSAQEDSTTSVPPEKIEKLKKKLNSLEKDLEEKKQKLRELKGDEDEEYIEGFNMMNMENEIRRGKNSRSIPVVKDLENSSMTAPYETGYFSPAFSLLK